MTEVNIENVEIEAPVVQEQKEVEIDYKAWHDENKDKVINSEAIIAKNRELLGKLAKTKEQKALVEKAQAEQAGEWEKLYKDQQNKIRNKTVEGLAKEIGLKYAGDAEAAEALAELIERKISDVVNEEGEFDVDDIESLKKEIETNKKYSRLLGDRNKGVGSGAIGNAKAVVHSSNELTYEQYSKLDPAQKSKFADDTVKGKAKLI